MTINLERFQAELIYTDTNSVKIIQDSLKDFFSLDQENELEKKKNQQYFWSCIGIALLLFFIGIFWIYAFVFCIFAATGAITLGMKISENERLDLDNVRYQLAKEILSKIECDRQPNRDLNIRLDFNSPTEKNKLVNTISDVNRPDYKKEIFTDPWLSIAGEFVDRTQFNLLVQEISIVSSGWKKSKSGKNKYKSKTKFKKIVLTLKLQYFQPPYKTITEEDLIEAIILPENIKIKNIQAIDNFLILQVSSPEKKLNILSETIQAMFVSLYKSLNRSRRLLKQEQEVNT